MDDVFVRRIGGLNGLGTYFGKKGLDGRRLLCYDVSDNEQLGNDGWD